MTRPSPVGATRGGGRRHVGLAANPRGVTGAVPERSHAISSIVREVIAEQGQPLDIGTRRRLEPRFGRDFSAVRVHTDDGAGESARAIDAAAYTVGPHVVFSPGQYAPATKVGRRLIAHELVHVAQNRAVTGSHEAPFTIGALGSGHEREANAIASAITAGTAVPVFPTSPSNPGEIQRAGVGELRLGEALEEERSARQRTAKDAAPMQGKIVTDKEKPTIDGMLKREGQPAPSPLAYPTGTKFVLHDTSVLYGPAGIAKEVGLGRGPLGKGSAGWVPRDTAAKLSRPAMFETSRPTPTHFEKFLELFEQKGDEKLKTGKARIDAWKGRRDDLFRQVWNAAKATERDTAMDEALKGLGLSADEIQEEKFGNATKDENKRVVKEKLLPIADQLKLGSTVDVNTAGAWTVEKLCERVEAAGAEVVADSGKEKELEVACQKIHPLFFWRGVRVGSRTNVEIVQVGTKDPNKSQNTCDPSNPNMLPMPKPPYTDNQYLNIAKLYLRAALTAGRFPEIMTHFVVDAAIGDHCDPRCFDLGKLYATIATLIGHPAGCTYGAAPSYGLVSGKNNIWWDDTICGGAHP